MTVDKFARRLTTDRGHRATFFPYVKTSREPEAEGCAKVDSAPEGGGLKVSHSCGVSQPRKNAHVSSGRGTMPAFGVPENGDILIRCDGPDAKCSFVVSSIRGPDQFGCATLTEAVRMASSYAEHAGVNVWLAPFGNVFTPLIRLQGAQRRMPGAVHLHPESRRTARIGP